MSSTSLRIAGAGFALALSLGMAVGVTPASAQDGSAPDTSAQVAQTQERLSTGLRVNRSAVECAAVKTRMEKRRKALPNQTQELAQANQAQQQVLKLLDDGRPDEAQAKADEQAAADEQATTDAEAKAAESDQMVQALSLKKQVSQTEQDMLGAQAKLDAQAKADAEAKAKESASARDDVKVTRDCTPEAQANKKVSIKPFNDCYVKNDDGTVVSYFGYDLGSPSTATLAAGSGYNFFQNINANSGQLSSFSQGTHALAFSVTWNSADPEPVWVLNGIAVKAASSGRICKETPAVPEFPIAIVGPVVALAAFGGWYILRRRNVAAV